MMRFNDCGTTVTQTVHTKTTVTNGVTTTVVDNSLTGASTTTTVTYRGTDRIVTTTDQVNLGRKQRGETPFVIFNADNKVEAQSGIIVGIPQMAQCETGNSVN